MTREQEIWLARRASAGTASGPREVLELTSPIMLRVIRRVLGPNASEAEDVLQESCFGLLGALASYRGECSLNHYAGRIAARHAVRARRKRQREDEKVVALRDWQPGHQPALDDRVDARTLLSELLGKLPEEQAESLVLRLVLGHTLPEIADTTGVPLNTVRSRIRLARERLSTMLTRRGMTA